MFQNPLTKALRSRLDFGDGCIHGYNWTIDNLRIWKLKPYRSLAANSIWTGVTITNCQFTRCTFRNTTFENVHSLNCRFEDVDFHDVTIRNSMVAHTTIKHSQVIASTFYSISWCYNTFAKCMLRDVVSDRSIWTYVQYEGIAVEKYRDSEITEHWVTMSKPMARPISR